MAENFITNWIMDYCFNGCEILDQERNLLFSNTDFSNEPYWDFKVENTIECTIEAKLDPNKKLNGCAQLIIAFKKGN